MNGPRLKFMAYVIAGQAPPGETVIDLEDAPDVLPFIQGNAEFGTEHPTPRLACATASKVAEAGDVLVSVRAPVGALNIASGPLGIGRGVAALRPCYGLDRRFIWWAMHFYSDRLKRLGTGSTYLAVTAEDIGSLRLPGHSLRAQRSIAHFLDRECERIASCWRGSRELQTAIMTAYAERWAFRLLHCQGRTDRLKFLVEAPVGGVWGGEAGSDQVDVVCARVADFDRKTLVVAPPNTVRSITDRDVDRLKLKDGDLLLEKSGGGVRSPVGFVVRYTGHQSPHMAVTSNFVARLRPRPRSDSLYLSHLLAALYRTRHNVAFIKQNTGIQNLDVDAYLSLRVPSRALHEQVALGQEAQDGLTAALEVRVQGAHLNAALERYRASLIHEAVTGKLDVTAASDRQMDERLHAAAEDRLDEVPV